MHGSVNAKIIERCATKFLRILDLLQGCYYRTRCLISTEKGTFQLSFERLANETGHESGNLVPVCCFANPVDCRICTFKMSRYDYFHAVGLPIDLSIFTLPGKPEASHEQHCNDTIYSTVSENDYVLERGKTKWIGNLLFWDKALSELGSGKKYGSMMDALRCAAKDLAGRQGRFIEQHNGEAPIEMNKTLNLLVILLKGLMRKDKKSIFPSATATLAPSPPSTTQAPATSAQSAIPPALSVTPSAPASSSNKRTKTTDAHPFFTRFA